MIITQKKPIDELLADQKASLTTKIVSIVLVDRGVIRAGMDVYKDGEKTGWVTSGTMVPYWNFDENGNKLETTGKRSIGFACIAGNPAVGDEIAVDVRGKKLKAKVVANHMIQNEPPYVKAVSDVNSPVTGVVAEINEELVDFPELLNENPYGAWIIKVENITAEEELMDSAALTGRLWKMH